MQTNLIVRNILAFGIAFTTGTVIGQVLDRVLPDDKTKGKFENGCIIVGKILLGMAVTGIVVNEILGPKPTEEKEEAE